MSIKWQQYKLRKDTVDLISEWVQEYCYHLGNSSREKQRIRLTVEEILLRILEQSEKELSVEAGIGRRYGRELFILRYDGLSLDPTGPEEDGGTGIMLSSLGISPVWIYRRHINEVSVPLSGRVRHGTTYGIIVAIAAAVILGLFGRLVPETVRAGLNMILLTPFTGCFLSLLRTFASLLITFEVVGGIVDMSSMSTLRRTGRTFLINIVLFCIAACVMAFILAVPALRPPMSGAARLSLSEAHKVSEMLFAILPPDPVTPYVTGNILQIIVISIFVGIGLLALGERGVHLQDLVREGTGLFSNIMAEICKLIPLYVFAALLQQFWFGNVESLLSVWKPIVIFLVIFCIYVVIALLVTSRQTTCPVRLLVKKIIPPFLIAFTTSSSVTAFQTGMNTGSEKLGIDLAFLRFAYPIGAVLYMPLVAASLIVLSVFFADEYVLAVNLPWCITAVVTATILAIAAPPVAGAGLMIYSTLYAQLGIPAEALLLSVLINVVYDFFISGGNIGCLLLELTREADKFGMLDREVLLRSESDTADE